MNVQSKSPVALENSGGSIMSLGSIGNSILALTAGSMTTSESNESQEEAHALAQQLTKLVTKNLSEKRKALEGNYAGEIASLRKRVTLLESENAAHTRDVVKTLLESMAYQVDLKSKEEDLAKLERLAGRLEMENSALVGYVKNDLVKLALASKAQVVLEQLRSVDSENRAVIRAELKKLSALLQTLEGFTVQAGTEMEATVADLKRQTTALIKELKEEIKPFDQPRIALLLDGLRQHLIVSQMDLALAALKDTDQAIAPDLGRIFGKLLELMQKLKAPASGASQEGSCTVA